MTFQNGNSNIECENVDFRVWSYRKSKLQKVELKLPHCVNLKGGFCFCSFTNDTESIWMASFFSDMENQNCVTAIGC